MRLFYAIKFNDNVKEALNNSLDEIKKHTARASFTEKNNFHITLVFVGECEPDKLEDLKKVADNTVAKLNPTPVKAVIDGLGTFPRPGDELLWAGVKTDPEDILGKINKIIVEELDGYRIKIKEDFKKFKPHVTIARRVEFRYALGRDLRQIKFEPVNFTVKSLTLMESVQEISVYGERKYTRIVYKPLYEVKF